MSERERVRIAVQRTGRLSDKSLDLLGRCGFEFDHKATTNFRQQRWRIARYVWSLKGN